MAYFDLTVVGAGIVGLAHALAAARRGLSVAVIERDRRAGCASVRNFGFVTVSGQEEKLTRPRALRSREVWAEVAQEANIRILQRGAIVVARRREALACLEEFAASAMGTDCELWNREEIRRRLPEVREGATGALSSPHELRIEARDALPRIAQWLAERHRVAFTWGASALALEATSVRHGEGSIEAGAVVLAPGGAASTFAPALAKRVDFRDCKLQMMRIASPGFRLPAVMMSDLSLARYEGFAKMPSIAALKHRLDAECARERAHGIHLIVAQGADGSLVVGDSHHYGPLADDLYSTQVEELILGELRALLDIPQATVVERWLGYYPVAAVQPVVSEEIAPRVRLVTVTSGTGMSTAFAIGEETISAMFD
jgi:FAD dependent oxidoreductase TIGR03364